LPHPWRSDRRAGYEALPRRRGYRLFDTGRWSFRRPESTPDKDTGLGEWTSEQIVAAIRKGKRPDGSELSGVMPWASFSHLTDEDALAIAAFLKSLPAVANKTPGLFDSSQTVPVSVSAVLPPEVYNALPASQK
jgi:hypothetical protein